MSGVIAATGAPEPIRPASAAPGSSAVNSVTVGGDSGGSGGTGAGTTGSGGGAGSAPAVAGATPGTAMTIPASAVAIVLVTIALEDLRHAVVGDDVVVVGGRTGQHRVGAQG